jgi:hypothetical protein
MNNLFYSLPLELQFRISEMNPLTIPEDIFNKVMLYNSHPVADMFKEAIRTKLDELNEPDEYEHEESFADHFFHEEDNQSKHIYHYAYMDEAYVNTLNEWNRNNYQNMIISVF